MARLMDDQDRRVLRNGVEIGAGRVALFLELRVVVAEADDEAVAFDHLAVLTRPVAQDALQRGDVVSLAVGLWQQVGRERLKPDHDDMAVRIDKAREQRFALEVDDRDRRLRLFLDLSPGTDGDDPAPAHEHRLGNRLRVIDRDDRAAGVECVTALGRRLRRVAEEAAHCPGHSGPGASGRRLLQNRAAR
jgi:hypothetical protein